MPFGALFFFVPPAVFQPSCHLNWHERHKGVQTSLQAHENRLRAIAPPYTGMSGTRPSVPLSHPPIRSKGWHDRAEWHALGRKLQTSRRALKTTPHTGTRAGLKAGLISGQVSQTRERR